jgi:hypothetical protein
VFAAIKQKAKEQEFLINRLSLIVNPVYILRKGLVKAIERNSNFVTGVVLDFGCGSKPYVALFKSAESYIGVDISSSGHDHSRIVPLIQSFHSKYLNMCLIWNRYCRRFLEF